MNAVTRKSIERFIDRLKANLWPDTDDQGLGRWQVDQMDMVLTNSGGTKRYVRLRLIPGTRGLLVEWEED